MELFQYKLRVTLSPFLQRLVGLHDIIPSRKGVSFDPLMFYMGITIDPLIKRRLTVVPCLRV